MKASIYFNYTSRSLLRGGQRTIMAVFCVAVGVMAIVALQLAGYMLQNSLTSNLRDTNGGDIAITAQSVPLKASDLAFFDHLKSAGTITNYTAIIGSRGLLDVLASSFQAFSVYAVEPDRYPLVTQPSFVTPSDGSVSRLLTQNQVIVTQGFIDTYHKTVGDGFNIYIKKPADAGITLPVKIAGVVANTGVFAQSGNLVLISAQDYQAISATSATYTMVDVSTLNTVRTDAAVKAINQQFPLVSTQTVADTLKSLQSYVDSISKFLEITGLLALLIGGVGIVNTMQVLLSRRKTEIAMLKTAGYRRMDLYALFGLEAGLLGLVGGVVGAIAAIGVSYIVRVLMQNFGLNIPFLLNPWIIIGGIAIGLLTSLIFGLMPIVQAANIRPLNVIRNLGESRGVSSVALTIGLLVILSVLFCGLAIVILKNDVLLGIEAVYGTFVFLLVLSVLFSLVVLIVSKMPVPEHFNLRFIALIIGGVLVSLLVYLQLPVVGVLLLAVSLMGIVIVLVPPSWKVSTKMALRNLGRQRARTTTTLLALFIGIFTIGLVLALGEDLQIQVNDAFAHKLSYNVFVTTFGDDTSALQAKLGTIPGLSTSRNDTFTQIIPVAINGQSLAQALPAGSDRQAALAFLTSMEGYDLVHATPSSQIVRGRNLIASDVGTGNVIISELLTNSGTFHMHLKPGDTITFASSDGRANKTVTVVGIAANSSIVDHTGGVLASTDTVAALSSATTGIATITYMKIDTAQVNSALNTLARIVPNATVQNSADLGTYFGQQLNSLLSILVALASLSLIAGVIIIANAVALAMLERRRELGILKAVGYTSSTVLSEVVIENGIIGLVGALMAMVLIAAAIGLLGKFAFNLSLSVSPVIVVSLVAGSALLAMITAALVAWSSVRVRPLEVLRYE